MNPMDTAPKSKDSTKMVLFRPTLWNSLRRLTW